MMRNMKAWPKQIVVHKKKYSLKGLLRDRIAQIEERIEECLRYSDLSWKQAAAALWSCSQVTTEETVVRETFSQRMELWALSLISHFVQREKWSRIKTHNLIDCGECFGWLIRVLEGARYGYWSQVFFSHMPTATSFFLGKKLWSDLQEWTQNMRVFILCVNVHQKASPAEHHQTAKWMGWYS